MRLNSMKIQNFRSVSEASLLECGNLNVLIGKNNSGKSNVLSAIQIFFDFLTADGTFATVNPPTKNLTDWYSRDGVAPIVITAFLTLSAHEMEDIRKAIADEAPQMRNALDEISVATELECQLTFHRTPEQVGYISKISFGESADGPVHRTIFGLDSPAGYEIAEREHRIREVRGEIRAIQRSGFIDVPLDEWRMVKDRRLPLQSVLPRSRTGELPENLLSQMTALIRGSDSPEEFQTRMAAHQSELQGRLSELLVAENVHTFQTFSGESAKIPKYATRLAGLIGSLKVHHLSEQRRPIGQDEASRFLRLKTSRGQGDVLQGIQATVSGLLGVKIDAFSNDRSSLRPGLMGAELDVDDFLVQVNGSGIREALRLILDYEFERPNVLLVEEPEVHLHPALEIAMMQYLRRISSDCQIFLTTHSTNFLDVADLRNVYLITKDESTHVQLLSVDDAEEAIPQELGIRLSSLFMYDRLVFVEGPSDEQMLRSFASTLGVNLSQAGVGFVTTGGARNFTHYANASTLAFLSKRRVRLYFIIDRDERDLLEIEDLRKKLNDLGELKVLERRELENYLIVPRALALYIGEKANKDLLGEAIEIGGLVAKAADDLLETAAERRVLRLACRPIIPDRKSVIERSDKDFVPVIIDRMNEAEARIAETKNKIADWLDEAHASFEGKSADEKLMLIPGDEIISSIFEHYGVRFNKRKDGPKIAALLTPDEIDPGIVRMLEDLTR